jgi:ABC-type nitrate/sulfonate/bicarbonate transport system ATPase subunit
MNNYELKQTILYLDNVAAGYDGKAILKGINIVEKDIVRTGVKATGQIIAFVGRSGRGKSTLFKVLTGLSKPMEGRILIPSSNPNDPDSAKEVSEGDVGFVDQKYTLFRHKTVFEIMMYALKNKSISTEEKKVLVNEQLVKWGLIDHKDKYPCELSGGQRQRTAIIEQLLTSKHYMIFDEPFSGLDVGNIESVKEAFNIILSSDELNTIIFSTHDLKLAVELSDEIYLIGYPENTKEYSTIIKRYDLKELGLSWTKFSMKHLDLVEEIKTDMLKS